MNKNIQTFLACDADYDQADLVLFRAPFDGTTSFRPGTRFRPFGHPGNPSASRPILLIATRISPTAAVFDSGTWNCPWATRPGCWR